MKKTINAGRLGAGIREGEESIKKAVFLASV